MEAQVSILRVIQIENIKTAYQLGLISRDEMICLYFILRGQK